MMRPSRRHFLASGAGVLAAGAGANAAATARGFAPHDSLTCALVGSGGRGTFVMGQAMALPGVRFATVCDVDESHANRAADVVEKAQGRRPRIERDYRRVLDDPALDALIIATPHHWHALIAVGALASGKSIYVEKPASHVFREGRLIADAAKRSGKIVQHGTQMRSSEVTAAARKVLDGGLLGTILMAKAFGVESRGNAFPDPLPDAPAPPALDYETWLGPAPQRPFNPLRVTRWNNFRDYGNGEIGGDGIHDLDMARWGLGATRHPVRITAHGSRARLKTGASDFPDNMVVTYTYDDGKVLIYENRNFAVYGERGYDNANIFYGTEGYMVFSRRGYFQTFLGRKEEPGPGQKGSDGVPAHVKNFFDCVRGGAPNNADAETAHLSCALSHLGEIAYRADRVIHFDPETETIRGDDAANAMLTKSYRKPYRFEA